MPKAEQDFKENNPREAYQDINFFMKGFAPSTTIYKNRDGEIISSKKKVIERKQYFKELLNTDITSQEAMDPRLERGREEPVTAELPSMEDVMAISKLKNNKARGMDNIPGELYKYGGNQIIATLHGLIMGKMDNKIHPRGMAD